jgi:TPR repeat protein
MFRWPLILLIGGLLAPSARGADLAALEKKAKAGAAAAQYQLGEILYQALKVKQDLPAARRWLEQAAAQGNAKAQYRLASMRFNGMGFPQNPDEGRRLFEESLPGLQKLASAGDADARGKLGMLYAKGMTVEPDQAKAVKLFQQAAAAGNVKAQFDLAGAYLLGKGVQKNPTLAGDWFEKAARAGSGLAQIQAGILCLNARGRRQDIAAGMKWIETAAKSGHPDDAKRAVGLLARLKDSPPAATPNIDKLIKQARAGGLKAQLQLARRYQAGDGVRVDSNETARWQRHAAAQGDGESCYQLGANYIKDIKNTPRDAARAARLWRLAAWLGHAPAQVDFSVMCAKGDGLPSDLKIAYHWLLIARRSRLHPLQKRNLDRLEELFARELDADQFFAGLGESRKFQPPKTPAERKAIAAAAFGDGAAQLKRGQALAQTFPVEALIWMRLAEAKKVKGAAEAAKAQAAGLAKKQLAEVDRRVKAFKPLAPPR